MRILVGYIIDGTTGGIDKYLTNMLKSIPFEHDDIQMDFLTNKITPQLESVLSQYHAAVYEVSTLKHPFKQFCQTREIMKKNHYDVAYFNISTTINCIGIIAAWKCKIKKRIIHSHSAGNDTDNVLNRILLNCLNFIGKQFLYKMGTDFYGCSGMAGKWIFPQKIVHSSHFHVIKNAVDTQKFAFSAEKRKEVRQSLHLEEKFVVGDVGFFSFQKNHVFLLEVFRQLLRQKPQSVLMLIGEGRLYQEIKERAQQMGIEESILFMGKRRDVNDLMQAMDVFAFPSRFEGLGIVGVEAQVSGLKCFFSVNVPEEIVFTDNCIFLSIKHKHDAVVWADSIIKNGMNYQREDASALAKNAGYNLEGQNFSFLWNEGVVQ